MADRTIIAFQVKSALFNEMVGVLDQLPSRTSRHLLNRIERGEVEPVYAGPHLDGHRLPESPNGQDVRESVHDPDDETARQSLANDKGAH